MINQGPQYTSAMDLVAVDIQRGRDFGLEDYRTVRAHLTGDILARFDQVSTDPLLIRFVKFAKFIPFPEHS